MSKQALKPDNFISRLPSMREPADTEEFTKDESYLAAMANSSGWSVLRNYIEQLMGELDEVNEAAIANGADLEKLGQNVLIITQTKGVLRKIINKVDDSRENREKAK